MNPNIARQIEDMKNATSFWVEIRSVYGNVAIYPVGPVAQHFAAIAGTKTLTPHTLRHVVALGYRIEVESGGAGKQAEILRQYMGGQSAR